MHTSDTQARLCGRSASLVRVRLSLHMRGERSLHRGRWRINARVCGAAGDPMSRVTVHLGTKFLASSRTGAWPPTPSGPIVGSMSSFPAREPRPPPPPVTESHGRWEAFCHLASAASATSLCAAWIPTRERPPAADQASHFQETTCQVLSHMHPCRHLVSPRTFQSFHS